MSERFLFPIILLHTEKTTRPILPPVFLCRKPAGGGRAARLRQGNDGPYGPTPPAPQTVKQCHTICSNAQAFWPPRRTQNPVGLTPRVGSTPTSGTGRVHISVFERMADTSDAHSRADHSAGLRPGRRDLRLLGIPAPNRLAACNLRWSFRSQGKEKRDSPGRASVLVWAGRLFSRDGSILPFFPPSKREGGLQHPGSENHPQRQNPLANVPRVDQINSAGHRGPPFFCFFGKNDTRPTKRPAGLPGRNKREGIVRSSGVRSETAAVVRETIRETEKQGA